MVITLQPRTKRSEEMGASHIRFKNFQRVRSVCNTGTTTLGQSGPRSNSNERELQNLQRSRSRTPPLDVV